MKKIVFLLLFVASLSATAQKKTLSMEDAMLKARTTLAPKNLKQLQFIKGTNTYLYTDNKSGKETWTTGIASSNTENTWLTLAQLNNLLTAAKVDTLKTLPAVQFIRNSTFIFHAKDKIILVHAENVHEPVITVLNTEKGETFLEANDQYRYAAMLKDNNLVVTDFNTENVITTDGSKDIVYGQSVHREEFGITKGTFWSNSGNQLAFYRMDQSMVNDYPIIDWSEHPAKNENIKYPMAGGTSHHVTVGVYNAATKAVVYLKTGEPAEQYLTNIAWSPDDKLIYIAVLNRGQDHMKLNQYDAATGDFVKTLFEETDDKYVEPLVPMLFLKNNPNQFVWQSNRDGFTHLYVYDVNGKMIKQLTKGAWEVLEVKGFDAKGENLFYVSNQVSPVEKNLYLVNIASGISKRITQGAGVHNTQVSTDGSQVLDVFSSTDNPRTVALIETKTAKTKTLLQAADPLSDYATGKLSIFSLKNDHGDELYCRLYKPVDFDSTKKYPVIVYWYGGSHAQLILNGWNGGAGDYWFQYMAERGYVVFTIDTRGSDNRGKAFEQSMFRKVGDVQMEDLMTGVNYLTRQSYVDKSNMGLFGWSFGGFLTTDFMLNHAGVFKAAVAGGPVINWAWYEVMYTERYMDTPQENPEGYAATDLTKQVDKLKGKLLLIHGLQDPTVVQQHSVNFVRAAIDKGIQVDYMIYPGHEHNVIGKDRAHLYQKVTDYFMQHLK